jgi:hypothetical protein
LVWIKGRNGSAADHLLFDTNRGATNALVTNGSGVTFTNINTLSAFNSNGFNIGSYVYVNGFGLTPTFPDIFVSWTFRKQPKFFDVVTYTGNGVAGRRVSHNLGSAPGMIITKRLDSGGSWACYHRSLGINQRIFLDATSAASTDSGAWGSSNPTSTDFGVSDSIVTQNNTNGASYVAYLFAHDAGGFGATGTDNVISCGSFQDNGSGTDLNVTLGYEPQWLLVKSTTSNGNWQLVDSMRGFVASPETTTSVLRPNLATAESTWNIVWGPTATGFQWNQNSGLTYIYIAIRRGPMKTPTTGTSVFSPTLSTDTGTVTITSGILTDAHLDMDRGSGAYGWWGSRLTGQTYLDTKAVDAQSTSSAWLWSYMDGYRTGSGSSNWVTYALKRAPGFFDVVCYTGTGSATSFTHNLGVAPQLMIVKGRSFVSSWHVYDATNGATNYMRFNNDPSTALSTIWNNTAPTSTQFTVGTSVGTNSSGQTYIAYLFATVAGVSKVGSYTGTGALQTVNCGFTGGARFVLIKRTDAGGDWWVYDSARGITSSDDPYLFLNTSGAEVTNTNYVDTTSVGFQVTAAAPAALNANGGTFIFLAIA